MERNFKEGGLQQTLVPRIGPLVNPGKKEPVQQEPVKQEPVKQDPEKASRLNRFLESCKEIWNGFNEWRKKRKIDPSSGQPNNVQNVHVFDVNRLDFEKIAACARKARTGKPKQGGSCF